MIYKRKDRIKSVILVDGFSFSGSGLLIDILLNNGYHAPRNIRLDEVNISSNNLSWTRLIDKNYSDSERIKISLQLLKLIFLRALINPIQHTFFYKFYLLIKKRNIYIHESTSVNRSIKSYFLSLVVLIKNKEVDREYFFLWFKKKYAKALRYENLLLDNGISYDSRILDWQTCFKKTSAFIVYRNPKIQYAQIKSYYSKTKVSNIPSYSAFLDNMILNYELKINYICANQVLIPVSFDQLLNDHSYRERIFGFLNRNGFIKHFFYNFLSSQQNNRLLEKTCNDYSLSESIKLKEIKIESLFEDFNEIFEVRISN